MKPTKAKRYRFAFTLGFALLLALSACGQYSVPITERPTRNVEPSLIGDWVSRNGRERMKIRALSDSTYIVSYSQILFQAFHSDIAGVAFLTVQELETTNRSYSYVTFRLSDSGTKLHLRLVNEKVIPEAVRDLGTVQTMLKRNFQNPALFHREEEFTKELEE